MRPTRRTFKRALSAGCWALTAAAGLLLAFAYLLPQWLRSTSTAYNLLAAGAFLVRTAPFYLGVACILALLIAVAMRRWRLAAVSAAVAVAGLLPALLHLLPVDQPPANGPAVRVMAMNLLAGTRDTAPAVAAIRAANPDVLLVEELTPLHVAALNKAFGEDYPHRLLYPNPATHGLGLYSRRPVRLIEPPVQTNANAWRVLTAALDVGGKQVVLYQVHFASPRKLNKIVGNRRQTADLIDRMAAEAAGENRPVIVAGDFNFSPTSPNAAALRRAGLRAAHDLAGPGPGGTWPAAAGRWLAFRIDEVYVSPSLTVSDAGVGGRTRSDHRPVWADVARARME